MRQIGTLPDEDAARTFGDFLLTRGVKANVEARDGEWIVWIVDEDDVEQAREELAQYRENPEAEHFSEGARAAADLRRQEEKQRKKSQKQVVDMRQRWNRPMSQQTAVTTTLIAISFIVVGLGTNWNLFMESPSLFRGPGFCKRPDSFVSYLYFANIEFDATSTAWVPRDGLSSILGGQIWRLFTPMFIHGGPLHILFNMMWLRDLGGVIEMKRGRWRYLLLVLAIAGFSNFGQYLHDGPYFGGMSGVVFGLFGYIWVKSRYQPESGFYMPPRVAFWMIAWFVICFTGSVGLIANTAHGVGMMVGMIVAYWPVFLRKMQGR